LQNNHFTGFFRKSIDDRSANIGGFQTLIMSIACGLLAANLYYAQPLTSAIGESLGLPAAALGLIVTLTQIGYCAGLLLVVPLADRFENRRLIACLVSTSAVAMACAGLAQGQKGFFVAVGIAGIASVGAQVLVPLAAHFSAPERQGRVIGTIMAGLLTGIMLARPVASTLAGLSNWRMAFLAPAFALALLAVLLWFTLPDRRPASRLGFGAILGSMLGLIREEPLLGRRAFYQACLFCAFNLFWTAAPLMLESEFAMHHGGIALFALAGAGGALAAPIAGHMVDRGLVRRGTIGAMALLGASFALTQPALAAGSVIALALLAIALDAATQANQVLSQSVVYALRPEARGRINAIYMSLMFAGGAAGSSLAPFLYVNAGWQGCAIAGVGVCLLALAAFATEPTKR